MQCTGVINAMCWEIEACRRGSTQWLIKESPRDDKFWRRISLNHCTNIDCTTLIFTLTTFCPTHRLRSPTNSITRDTRMSQSVKRLTTRFQSVHRMRDRRPNRLHRHSLQLSVLVLPVQTRRLCLLRHRNTTRRLEVWTSRLFSLLRRGRKHSFRSLVFDLFCIIYIVCIAISIHRILCHFVFTFSARQFTAYAHEFISLFRTDFCWSPRAGGWL